MKRQVAEDQNIVDLLLNYGDLNNLYSFIVENDIDYVNKGALTLDFYDIDETTINGDSKFLIDNSHTVVNGDDEAYYPPFATSNIYSNLKIDDVSVTQNGDFYTFEATLTNYGYKASDVIFNYYLYSDNTLLDDDTLDGTNGMEYLETRKATITLELPNAEFYRVYFFQGSASIPKNVYEKEIDLRNE